MAEKTGSTPGFDPGRCILANRWHYRTRYMERPGCPFGACFQCADPVNSGLSQRSLDILLSIHYYGCREWRSYSALDTPQ
jgi:hypothetical protein